jgi:hypothetical protein
MLLLVGAVSEERIRLVLLSLSAAAGILVYLSR